jgi:serine/threonine protein kinase
MVGDVGFRGTSRFEVLRRLGAGGMGVVHEALDRESGERVALKTLRFPTADALLRFKHEFHALQGIHHRNLARLGELISENGQWFFTMELIAGGDFLRHVRRGEELDPSLAPTLDGHVFDEVRLRDALAQLVSGLRALHAAGKIHRDIKPSNVLVERDGRVIVLDFGLVTDGGGGGSSTANIVGTVEYMAPEQAASQQVGPGADWYAAGVLLFEAMYGRLPFTGPPLHVLMRKQREAAEEGPNAARLPADLRALCRELLHIAPEDRPDGAAIARRVGGGGEATSERRPSPPSLLGRDAELAQLDQALADSRGGAVTVVITGESPGARPAPRRSRARELARQPCRRPGQRRPRTRRSRGLPRRHRGHRQRRRPRAAPQGRRAVPPQRPHHRGPRRDRRGLARRRDAHAAHIAADPRAAAL